MENISSPSMIQAQAEDYTDDLRVMLQEYKNDGNNIFCTVAHFCRRKGGDFAIEAAEMLKKQHIKI